MTNFDENISPETVFELYNKRGTMENYMRMMMSVIAYNLLQCLKYFASDSQQTGMPIQTIRLKFFKIAGKLVRTARKIQLKLSIYHVHQEEFYKIFERL